jgi:hypothetical protein
VFFVSFQSSPLIKNNTPTKYAKPTGQLNESQAALLHLSKKPATCCIPNNLNQSLIPGYMRYITFNILDISRLD